MTEIIPTIITSVTSIIIALITAGVFNMMKEKRAKQNSRNKLSQQIETDEIVHSTLREIRRKYKSRTLLHYYSLSSYIYLGASRSACELERIGCVLVTKTWGTNSKKEKECVLSQ